LNIGCMCTSSLARLTGFAQYGRTWACTAT